METPPQADLLDFVEVSRGVPGAPPWRIARRLRPASGEGRWRPGVVWLGGFNSDMLGVKATRIDAWAREHGRACLRFDYSGHGESGGAFADGCVGDWLEQSAALFEASTQGPQILVGSSMGAWIALLLARRLAAQGALDHAAFGRNRPIADNVIDSKSSERALCEKPVATFSQRALDRLAGLVLLAPAPDFTERLIWDNLDDAARADIMERGVWSRPSPYAPNPTPITRRLIEDGRKHLLMDGVVRSHAPVHILQGAEDADVPWRYALGLAERLAADPVVFTLIPGGDHRLSRDEDLARMVSAIEQVAEA